LGKVPYMAVVGQREAEAGAVAVRHRTGGDLGAIPMADFTAGLREEIDSKGNSCPLMDGTGK
jgi:threonyl-tRNA synthetase